MKIDGTPGETTVQLPSYFTRKQERVAFWLQAIITPPTALSSQRGKRRERIMWRGSFTLIDFEVVPNLLVWWNVFIWSEFKVDVKVLLVELRVSVRFAHYLVEWQKLDISVIITSALLPLLSISTIIHCLFLLFFFTISTVYQSTT